jgi:hypothetical protein
LAQDGLANLGVVDPDKGHGRKHLIMPPGYGSIKVAFRPAADPVFLYLYDNIGVIVSSTQVLPILVPILARRSDG